MCQFGVMTGYGVESKMFETRCVSDFCDDWLRLDSISFESQCESDCCNDWQHGGKYNV